MGSRTACNCSCHGLHANYSIHLPWCIEQDIGSQCCIMMSANSAWRLWTATYFSPMKSVRSSYICINHPLGVCTSLNGDVSEWCKDKGTSPSQAPLKTIFEYLLFFKSGSLAYSLLKALLVAIYCYHMGLAGKSAFSHRLPKRFLRGLSNNYPPQEQLVPNGPFQ